MIQIEAKIIHVGAMLALCWLIIRSWALLRRLLGAIGPLLCVSWLLVGVLDRFFSVRDWSGLDLGGFGDHPGRVFRASKPDFSMVWGTHRLAFRKCSGHAKT